MRIALIALALSLNALADVDLTPAQNLINSWYPPVQQQAPQQEFNPWLRQPQPQRNCVVVPRYGYDGQVVRYEVRCE